MSIRHIVLGFLNADSQSGYDLKKAIANHPFMPWSGNNNQIYQSLFELENMEAIVSKQVLQYGAPNKKVYSINRVGRELLRQWLLEPIPLAKINHPLMIKLQFAEKLLSRQNLIELLVDYRNTLLDQVEKQTHAMLPNSLALLVFPPEPNLLAKHCNTLFLQYQIRQTQAEIDMVNQILDIVGGNVKATRTQLDNSQKQESSSQTENEALTPKGHLAEIGAPESYQVMVKRMEINQVVFLDVDSRGPIINAERDAIELTSLCSEHSTQRVLVSSNFFNDNFFHLKTGLAGSILQKLSNNNIRLALLRNPDQKIKGKVLKYLSASQWGNQFAVFQERAAAIEWLIQ